MRRIIVLIVASLAATAELGAQSPGELLQIEVAAARQALTGNIARNMIVIDSAFAAPDAAPGVPTANARPARRTLALREALAVPATYNRPYGQTLLVLSEPRVTGDVAVVTTTTYRVAQSGRRNHETLRVTLRRQEGKWQVEKAEPLQGS